MRLGRLAVPVINDPASATALSWAGRNAARGHRRHHRRYRADGGTRAGGRRTACRRGHPGAAFERTHLKPIDEEALCAAARETGGIEAAEEHSVIGGLFTARCAKRC